MWENVIYNQLLGPDYLPEIPFISIQTLLMAYYKNGKF